MRHIAASLAISLEAFRPILRKLGRQADIKRRRQLKVAKNVVRSDELVHALQHQPLILNDLLRLLRAMDSGVCAETAECIWAYVAGVTTTCSRDGFSSFEDENVLAWNTNV